MLEQDYLSASTRYIADSTEIFSPFSYQQVFVAPKGCLNWAKHSQPVLTTLMGQNLEHVNRIDGFTSRSPYVTNMAVFWSKRSSKNHCSQWEPFGILSIFLIILQKPLLGSSDHI